MATRNAHISAWELTSVNLLSPDGKKRAVVDNLTEYGMGSPTIGLLNLSGGLSLNYCSPSIVWSDDSQYLAVPQLTEQGFEQLLVIDANTKEIGYVAKEFKVLELYTFINGVITGVNNAATLASPVVVNMNEICWD